MPIRNVHPTVERGAKRPGAPWRQLVFLWWLTVCVLGGCGAFANIRSQPSPTDPHSRHPLTVMSFNIRVGYGNRDHGVDPFTLSRRQERLGPIADAIRSQDADIVGLQEVRGRDQAERLARRLNMNYAYAGHATGVSLPSWWGVALLSKYPVTSAKGFAISYGRGNCKSALQCALDIGGRPMIFIVVHKDKDVKDGSPLRRVMARISRTDGMVILMGDFNMQPRDPRLAIVKSRFVDSAWTAQTTRARAARRTGTFLGVGRIDYIWIDPHQFKVVDAGLVDRRFWNASDHLAYWTRVVPIE